MDYGESETFKRYTYMYLGSLLNFGSLNAWSKLSCRLRRGTPKKLGRDSSAGYYFRVFQASDNLYALLSPSILKLDIRALLKVCEKALPLIVTTIQRRNGHRMEVQTRFEMYIWTNMVTLKPLVIKQFMTWQVIWYPRSFLWGPFLEKLMSFDFMSAPSIYSTLMIRYCQHITNMTKKVWNGKRILFHKCRLITREKPILNSRHLRNCLQTHLISM